MRVSKPYTRCLPARLWRQRDIDIRKAREHSPYGFEGSVDGGAVDPRHPEKLDRYAELAKNDKTATQSHLTESTFIFDQGFILVGSFVDILFTLVAVTIVMRVCKYLTPEPAWWMLV